MADTTSVGVIQLDVEINPKSLNLEMDKLGKAFNNSFKNMFSGMVRQNNNFIKESISNIGKSFRNFGQTGLGASEKVSKSVSKMNAEYEKTEAKISKIRSELEQLFAAQDVIVRSYQDFPALSGLTKDETIEQLLKSDPKFNELSTQIDKLISELDPLVAKNKELAEEIENVGDKSDNTGNKFNKMGNSAKKAGKSIFNLSWLKRMFTNESKKASNATSNFGKTMSRVSRMIARNLIVYGLIIKGLKGMISYMWSALKTNQQFAQSLNIIRTNLLVAFQPIYNFIIPALNALMQAIARVTQYIATAISALFGKTYQQSFNAAKSMNSAIKGMDGYGKAAKKAGKEAKGALMGFDEINQLDIKDDADSGGGSGAGDFEMTMPDTSTIDLSGLEKFKELLQPTIDSLQNLGKALEPLKNFAVQGLKDFYNEFLVPVGKWTFGEGLPRFIDAITKGLGQINWDRLNNSLKDLWKNLAVFSMNVGEGALRFWEKFLVPLSTWVVGEGFPRLVDIISNGLAQINWEPILNAFDRLWEALLPFAINVGEGLLWFLENVLTPLGVWTINEIVPRFLDLLSEGLTILNNTIDVLKPYWQWLWDNLFKPIAEWTGGMILSILDGVIEGLRNIGDWIRDNQGAVESIAIIAGSFAAAWGLVNIAMGVWNVVGVIAAGVTTAFGTAMAFITSPIGLVTLAIGALIAVGVLLYKNWEEIGPWIKATWESIKEKAIEVWTKIKEFFIESWNAIKENTSEVWNNIKEFLSETWNNLKENVSEIWNSIKEFISNIWDNIKTKTSETWNNIKSFLIDKIWNPIKNTAQTIWQGIKKNILDPINQAWSNLKSIWDKIKKYILDKWNEIKTGISSMKDNLVNAIKEPFNIAKNWIDGIIGDAFNWGKNLIGNFIDGIKSMARKVTDAVSGVVGGIKDFLGFSSPTKKGPGSDADKWMPNLMGMLADGIQDNIYEVSAAVSMTAGSIQQGIQPNTDDMAGAIGSAVLQSMQMANNNNQGQESGDIILQIDGITVGRILGPIMDREKERIGEPVIKPI